jgi:seryl-tRNA synthetase
MLDIKLIREDPEPFREALARRGLAERVDELLAADERRRELTRRVEDLRAEQNRSSKAIGGAQGDEKQRLIAEVAKVSAELKELDPQLAEAETALTLLLAATPNLPHPSSPDGFTDEDAVEVRRNHDAPPVFDFEPKDHANLGAALGVLDVERGSRTRLASSADDDIVFVSSLMRSAMDILAGGLHPGGDAAGPGAPGRCTGRSSSRRTPSTSTGPPRTSYLVGTAEGAAGGTPPGRGRGRGGPAGSLRGVLDVFPARGRHHGWNGGMIPRPPVQAKVEMFSYHAQDATGRARVPGEASRRRCSASSQAPVPGVNIAAGISRWLGGEEYDIRVWLPGQQRCKGLLSNTTDYQARRMQTRYAGATGAWRRCTP